MLPNSYQAARVFIRSTLRPNPIPRSLGNGVCHQRSRSMSTVKTIPASFSEVPAAPVDPMFMLKKEYDHDTHPLKVDLRAGVLWDEQGACYEFAVVKEAKLELIYIGLTIYSRKWLFFGLYVRKIKILNIRNLFSSIYYNS